MLKNILVLTVHDLVTAFKNKSIYLIVFIPCLVFFSLKLVDMSDAEVKRTTIGIIQTERYAPVILKTIKEAENLFTVSIVANKEEGIQWLKEKKIAGLLFASQKEKNTLTLVVVKKESLQTLAIVENVTALQKAIEGNSINWISAIQPLREGGIQKQTLPVWILMLVLVVSFIVLPAQVAEEKEKKLILALLQTPIREIEWLSAKVFSGMLLILIGVMLLHLLGSFALGNAVSYLLFIGIGSFCFSSFGIFLGFLCRNQTSARTLGVIFYLPLLLPSALSDFSDKLTAVAPVLPSYHFYEPIKSILLEDGRIANMSLEWFYLLSVGLTAFLFAHRLLKKRWLM